MLRKLGFAERWIRLLMTCVRSVSYALLINGQPHGHIIPSRGIRQRDPLSPYFFTICAEALTSMLNHSTGMGKFLGVPISRGGTRISHLLFADDSLLFMRASSRYWQHVTEILDIYERASGQKVNLEKTSLFFSRNTREEVRASILQETGLALLSSMRPIWGYRLLLAAPEFLLSISSKLEFETE
jgi:hypothetical protein